MSKRSYDQYCPLARSLDLLGERWTLLIVRDLIAGPRRYTDLRSELDGIASDILTQRLRDLEAAGVVQRRRLPPPAASAVYELTERGRELEPALLGLARFGIGLLEEGPTPEQTPSAERFELLLRVLFDPDGAPAERRTVLIGDGPRALLVSFGRDGFEVSEEPDAGPEPDATLTGDPPTLYELMIGRTNAEQAVASGELRIGGDPAVVEMLAASFPARRGTAAVAA